MHSSLINYLAERAPKDDLGSSIYEHEVRRALNHAGKHGSLDQLLEAGYYIHSCTRVLYSSQNNWIDVLVSLHHCQDEDKNIVITYESDTDRFVSCAFFNEKPKTFDENMSDLPFALATRSYSDTVFATEDQMSALDSRRQIFMKALVLALAPFMGVVSPAMAASTPYTTTSNTPTNTAQTTPYGTTGPTTQGGDNDTREDTRGDTVTDNQQDSTQDTRDDP